MSCIVLVALQNYSTRNSQTHGSYQDFSTTVMHLVVEFVRMPMEEVKKQISTL